jgi:hypothetical protein
MACYDTPVIFKAQSAAELVVVVVGTIFTVSMSLGATVNWLEVVEQELPAVDVVQLMDVAVGDPKLAAW